MIDSPFEAFELFLAALLSGQLQWRNAYFLALCVLPVVLFAWSVWGRKRHQAHYADAHLWPWVKVQAASAIDHRMGRRIKHRLKSLVNPSVLLAMAWCCLVVALAGPRVALNLNDLADSQVERGGMDIVVAVDLSHSMTANDVLPNRFLQARSLIESLVKTPATASLKPSLNSAVPSLQTNDRLALLGFAGSPHVVSPLSQDRALFSHYLNLLQPNLLPTQGSWIELALIESMSHLAQLQGSTTRARPAVVVLFTDGAPAFWQDVALPERFANSPFAPWVLAKTRPAQSTVVWPKVIVVGVGTPRATPLSGFVGGFADATQAASATKESLFVNGLLVQSRLEEAALKQLAQQLNGVYLHGDTSGAFRQTLLTQIVSAASLLQKEPSTEQSAKQAAGHIQWQTLAWPFMQLGGVLLLLAFYGVLSWLSFVRVKAPIKAPVKVLINHQAWWIVALTTGVLSVFSTGYSAPVMAQSSAQQNTPHIEHRHQLLQSAQRAYQAQDYQAALTQYAQVADYQGWFGAGAAAYQQDDLLAAVAYFRQAAWGAQTDQERAAALFNLGNSYQQANIFPWAIEAYQQALVYQADHPKALHNLAVSQARGVLYALKQAQLKKQAKEDLAKQADEANEEGGQGKGKGKGRNAESAFYGGQKPDPSAEPASDKGDGIDGGQSDGKVILPLVQRATQYSADSTNVKFDPRQPWTAKDALSDNLTNDLTTDPMRDDTANLAGSRLALIEQAQRQQRAEAFEQRVVALKDEQKILLQRLFEREEGFDAPQAHPHPIPGVQPW